MRQYRVLWAESAKNDLRDIVEYIALDSLAIAKQKYQELREAAESLSSFPNSGKLIPELEKHNISIYREKVVSPWRIFYKVEERTVYVLAVIDARRNVEDILLRRQLR